jgi:hypothetical protein
VQVRIIQRFRFASRTTLLESRGSQYAAHASISFRRFSSASLRGSVSSDLPFKAIQILQYHGIIADKYVLSPHSVNLFVPVESREAAVKALHSLI